MDFPQLVFSADGFTARPEIIAHAESKAISLCRRAHPGVGVVRVRVSRESAHVGPSQFVATAVARGPVEECVAHGLASEPRPAIDEAFRKLERALASAAEARAQARPPAPGENTLGGEPPNRRASGKRGQ